MKEKKGEFSGPLMCVGVCKSCPWDEVCALQIDGMNISLENASPNLLIKQKL